MIPNAKNIYIPREDIESVALSAMTQNSQIIRIKAVKGLGKTALLKKLCRYANEINYKVCLLNLKSIATSHTENLKVFTQWFCTAITKELCFQNNLYESWSNVFTSNLNAINYLESYILPQLDTPFLIALDNIDSIENYPHIAQDFYGLLRSIYKKSRTHSPSSSLWEKLRIILTHTYEIKSPLHLYQSPFNVGIPLELNGFNQKEITNLLAHYHLSSCLFDFDLLTFWFAGKPELLHLLCLALQSGLMSLSELESKNNINHDIFDFHLTSLHSYLKSKPNILDRYLSILESNYPVSVEYELVDELKYLGLINYYGNYATVSCNLYRSYFKSKFF